MATEGSLTSDDDDKGRCIAKEVKTSGRTIRGSVDRQQALSCFQRFAEDILQLVSEVPRGCTPTPTSNPSSCIIFAPAHSSPATLASTLFLEHTGCVLAPRLSPQGATWLTPLLLSNLSSLSACGLPRAPQYTPSFSPGMANPLDPALFFLYGTCYILIYYIFLTYHLIQVRIMFIICCLTLPTRL